MSSPAATIAGLSRPASAELTALFEPVAGFAPVAGPGTRSRRRSPAPLLAPAAALAQSRLRAGARGGLAPVALLADVAHDDGTLSGFQVSLQAGWHPGLAALLGDAGASVGRVGAACDPAQLRAVLTALPPGAVVPRDRVRLARQRRTLDGSARAELVRELRAELDGLPGAAEQLAGLDLGRRVQVRADGGVVALWRDGHKVRLRAGLVAPLLVGPDELPLGGFVRGALTGVVVSLPESLAWIDAAADAGLLVVDLSDGALAHAARRLDRTVVVTGVRGAPGLAVVSTGRRADQRQVVEASRIPAGGLPAEALEVASPVRDVARMEAAAPEGRSGLHAYQDHFVSRYLATELGVVNALAPGLGKTVCAAHALRERGPATRALIVVPAPLRDQWVAELVAHHRGARVEALYSRHDLGRAMVALSHPGPVCVVASFDLARTHVDTLAAQRWTDLVVDEAAFLKSSRSARVRALWRLRECAERTMVLTGTPIDRTVDDLAPLVAFARRDVAMFDGARLSQRAKAARLSQVLGPTVFRTTTDAAGLPPVRWEVYPVELSPAERELVDYSVTRLREAVEHLRAAEAARTPTLAAMGAVLRELNVVRAAACDPAAVKAALVPAELYARLPGVYQGLFATACPAKRDQVAAGVAAHVERGGQALVCSDFLPAGQALAEELSARSVPVAVISSRLAAPARARALVAFNEGRLSALVLSGLARQGLNLQRADLVVHYDLPLSSAALTQRVGRALRLGTRAELVRSVVPVAQGTVDEVLVELVRDAQARAMDWLDGMGAASSSHGALAVAALLCAQSAPGDEGVDLDGLAR